MFHVPVSQKYILKPNDNQNDRNHDNKTGRFQRGYQPKLIGLKNRTEKPRNIRSE